MRNTWRLRLYRFLIGQYLGKWFIEQAFPSGRVPIHRQLLFGNEVRVETGTAPIWFHAASVGELESIWSVVEHWLNVADSRVILTVFSESARQHLQKLTEGLSRRAGKVLSSGYSPSEGEWGEALMRLKPQVFVTAKYEAWPELWASLTVLGIPLVIIGARVRSSLRVAKWVCRLLGCRLPKMLLLPFAEGDRVGLAKSFPKSTIHSVSDPRWDRVKDRLERGNDRARSLISAFSAAVRPWGVLGSIWVEDLHFWGARMTHLGGTLWIVPHKVDPLHLKEIETSLLELGISFVKSSKVVTGNSEKAFQEPRVVLVDEVGFLLELYSAADWAYVGGGFGKGLHSTIEPAVARLPIAAGSKNADLFVEVGMLEQSSQLKLLRGSGDLNQWLSELGSLLVTDENPQRLRWARDLDLRLGATKKVIDELLTLTSRSC